MKTIKITKSRVAAMLLLSLFLTFTGCTKVNTWEGFHLDTGVSIVATGARKDDMDKLTEIFKEVTAAAEQCYVTPANKLDNEMIGGMRILTAGFSQVFDPEADYIDLYIGTVTRLWGIPTDNPKVPSEDEIAAALNLMHDGRVTDDENGGLYADFSKLPDGVYIDPGAIAKGYAIDRIYDTFETTMDISNATVSAGSSVLHYGTKSDGSMFTTGIKSPFINFEEWANDPANNPENFDSSEDALTSEQSTYIGYIETPAAFISTSGGYERYFEADGVRYSHIFDPETGYPVETDLVSVTVIVPAIPDTGDCGIMSDYLSTLMFMRGTAGLADYDKYQEIFTYVAIDKDGKIYGNQPLLPV